MQMEKTIWSTGLGRMLVMGRYNVKRWGSDSWVRGLKRSAGKDGPMFKKWKYLSMFLVSSRVWPNSLNAHRLLYYARAIKFARLHELTLRLFQATYEEGKNISRVDTLVEIAEEMGLEGVGELLQSNQFKSEVLEEDEFAKHDLEIGYFVFAHWNCSVNSYPRGVPFYIINNRYTLEGANPPSAFLSIFRIMERSNSEEEENHANEEDDGADE